jgi:hypothetical protein
VKVLFRRQVYSNSFLEKSAKGVRNTPPPPFVPCLALRRAWSEKKFLPWEKILPWRRVQLQRDKGIEDRVSSKIWVD